MTRDRHDSPLDDDAIAVLAAGLPAVAPDESRRARMRARVLEAAAGPGISIVRKDEGDWLPFVDGIVVKSLRRDEDAGTQTSLWRMQPGAGIPTHGHRQEEECLILEGSIVHDGVEYFAGDYLLVLPQSRHKVILSPNGALLLIRSELIPKMTWFTRAAMWWMSR